MTEHGNDWGWFRDITPAVIRRNPYLGHLFGLETETPTRVPVRIVFSAGRYDRELRRETVRGYMRRGDILLFTEKQSDKSRRPLLGWDGWHLINIGRGGEDECAALINTNVFNVDGYNASPMSKNPVPRRGGQINHALTVRLTHKAIERPVTISVAHTRSGIEGAWNTHQGDAYRADMQGWRRIGADIMVGDLNLDCRRGWVREYFRTTFPDKRLNWRNGDTPLQGTHGARLIDGAISALPLRHTHLLPDDNSSDHRPFKVTYWLDRKGK